MNKVIELNKLTIDELMGVIELYPWFGSARKELCKRIGEMGEENVSLRQFADAAIYLPSRARVYEIYRSLKKEDYSDINISELLKSYIEPTQEKVSIKRVAGGDFFSSTEYETINSSDNFVLPKFKSFDRDDSDRGDDLDSEDLDFCTETLAQIYVDQGYYDRAIRIYSKLILAYPEKSAYFAPLIENLKKTIDKL